MRGTLKLILCLLVLSLCAPFFADEAVAFDDGIVPATPKARTQIAPFYPMTVSGLNANVTMAVEVGANGKVTGLRTVDCDRPGLGFEAAAMDAVKHWRFKPAMSAAGAVSSETYVNIYMTPPMVSSQRYANTRVNISMERSVIIGRLTASTNSHGGRDTIRGPDRPPCGPDSGECIYDRSGFNQNIREVNLPKSPEPPSQPTSAARRQLRSAAASGRGR